jgi:hypothetical protein
MGYFHLGVIKALFETKQLPYLLSGASAGSLIAVFLGVRTNAEIREVMKEGAGMYICVCVLKYVFCHISIQFTISIIYTHRHAQILYPSRREHMDKGVYVSVCTFMMVLLDIYACIFEPTKPPLTHTTHYIPHHYTLHQTLHTAHMPHQPLHTAHFTPHT